MAITVTIIKKRDLPIRPYAVASIALDASYPTGGEVLTAANFGFDNTVDMVICGPALASSNFLQAAFDPTTSKLQVFYPVGGTAAAPTTVAQPVATVVPDAGATTMTGSAAKPTLTATTTPGAGKEVGSTADLSAFTIYCIAFGS